MIRSPHPWPGRRAGSEQRSWRLSVYHGPRALRSPRNRRGMARRRPARIRRGRCRVRGPRFRWIRGFKIADNQSPIPQDRVFFNFNYYNNVNYAIDRKFGAPVNGIQIYRYLAGFEKTFLGGLASIGLTESLNNLSAVSSR